VCPQHPMVILRRKRTGQVRLAGDVSVVVDPVRNAGVPAKRAEVLNPSSSLFFQSASAFFASSARQKVLRAGSHHLAEIAHRVFARVGLPGRSRRKADGRIQSQIWRWGKNQGRNRCILRMTYNSRVPASPKSTKRRVVLAGHLHARINGRNVIDKPLSRRQRRSSTVRCLEKTRSMVPCTRPTASPMR
jgi:hypothetical protein